MPITTVRDNENNKWQKKTKQQRQYEGTEERKKGRKKEVVQAILKAWELNDFVVPLI